MSAPMLGPGDVPIQVTSQIAVQTAVNLLTGANQLSTTLGPLLEAQSHVTTNAVAHAVRAISDLASSWVMVADHLRAREQDGRTADWPPPGLR